MTHLATYFLGPIPLLECQFILRRLAFELGESHSGALVLCEHPPCISMGREGSRKHLKISPEVLCADGLHVQWVPRGGRAMLHGPGQVSLYPILNLQELNRTPAAFRDDLQQIVWEIVTAHNVPARCESRPGVWVGDRLIAHTGFAVRQGISQFGITLNANPDLSPFRILQVDGTSESMTSLARESRLQVRVATIRQSMALAVCDRFGFAGPNIFHHLPFRAIKKSE